MEIENVMEVVSHYHSSGYGIMDTVIKKDTLEAVFLVQEGLKKTVLKWYNWEEINLKKKKNCENEVFYHHQTLWLWDCSLWMEIAGGKLQNDSSLFQKKYLHKRN